MKSSLDDGRWTCLMSSAAGRECEASCWALNLEQVITGTQGVKVDQ